RAERTKAALNGKRRPAMDTSPLPCASIACRSPSMLSSTWLTAEGAPMVAARCSDASIRSSTSPGKPTLAKSPSLEPSPVKSKRNVAMPSRASSSVILTAARLARVQVKQCANNATARTGPTGCTTVPLSTCPERVVKLLSVRDMGDLLGLRAGRALRRRGRGNHPLVVCAPWVAPTIILTCNGRLTRLLMGWHLQQRRLMTQPQRPGEQTGWPTDRGATHE